MKFTLILVASLVISSATLAQVDSAQFFYQKGMTEKQAGRKLESWKNFDKAYRYNSNDKAIVSELATVLFDLRKYGQAREMFRNKNN